jgi:rhodanese-related sulfurtransferase
MAVKRVTPREAKDLLDQGYKYLDVRSVQEFSGGHPAGAYNVPLVQPGPGRMVPNADFQKVVARHFPPGEPLVVGCGSGGRSLRACELLVAAGWTNIVDVRGGWGGERDAFGRVAVRGWLEEGLPTEQKAAAGRGYDDLSR